LYVLSALYCPHQLGQLPDPGTLPSRPQIPRDLRSPTPESVPSSPVPTDRESFYTPLPGLKDGYKYPGDIRSQRSPSEWSSELGASPHSPTRTGYSSYEPARRISASSTVLPATGPRKENRGYESPSSDEEPEQLDRFISKAIDVLIQNDGEWEHFFESTAAPQRASEVLKQYRFVQRMMDEWVGKRAPFRRHHHIVKAVSATGPSSLYTSDIGLSTISLVHCASRIRSTARPARRHLHYLRFMDLRANTMRTTESWL
jgi:hypothetical protein